MSDSSNKTFWGTLEYSCYLLLACVVGLVFQRASGGEWFTGNVAAGACVMAYLLALVAAALAPTPTGRVLRFAVPSLIVFLLYNHAGSFAELQARMGIAHLLLLLAVSIAAIHFSSARTADSASVESEPAKEAKPKPKRAGLKAFDRIVGQNQVVGPLKEIARIARSGIRVGKRDAPHAVLLFLGPTGVGKTEAARALAEAVYGNPDALIRFDMGQFIDAHQANRFYGPPPGYVGYEEGGQLTRAVLRKPKSVVLLDEMEKAHPQIWDAFLPVFDEGYIVDGSSNEKVDMTNTTIVLTSNLLAGHEDVGSLNAAELKERVVASGALRPELLGRINEILVFNPLSRDAIGEILKRRLDASLWSLAEQGVQVDVDQQQIDQMIEELQAAKFGVRQIDDVVRKFLRKEIDSGARH